MDFLPTNKNCDQNQKNTFFAAVWLAISTSKVEVQSVNAKPDKYVFTKSLCLLCFIFVNQLGDICL